MKLTNKIKDFLHFLTRPRVQIIGVLLTTVIITWLFYKPIKNFTATDKQPTIQRYTQAELANKDIAVVETGLFIKNFPKFNFTNNEFSIEGLIWFYFDTKKVSQEIINNFSFEKGIISEKSQPIITESEDKTLVNYTFRLDFNADLYYHLFPLEDHYIVLMLTNNFVSTQKMIYVTSPGNFLISRETRTPGWDPVHHTVAQGYAITELVSKQGTVTLKNPVVMYTIDAAVSDFRKSSMIILPLIILFFVVLLSLALPSPILSSSILSISTVSLSSLLAYRYIIDTMAPRVSYFMLSDHIFLIFLIAIFITLIVNFYLVTRKPEHKDRAELVKGATYLLLQLGVIIYIYGLLAYWGLV